MEIRITCDTKDMVNLDDLRVIQGQLKTLSEENFAKLKNQIINEGFSFPCFVWEHNGLYNLLDGSHRFLTMMKLREEGFEIPLIPVVKVEARDLSHAKKKLLAVTSSYARISDEGLYEFLDDVDWKLEELDGFELEGIDNDMFMDKFFEDETKELDDSKEDEGINLTEKYGAPPMSILDTRQGYWQDRKKAWLNIGLKSEEGRDVNHKTKIEEMKSEFSTGFEAVSIETSVFDPFLCELMYRWFCPEAGKVLDPFAGGSARGIVAAELGLDYYGNDLSSRQIDANVKQADNICKNKKPTWSCNDSVLIKDIMVGHEFDMMLSCPPYADLEVYSDDDRDISNMPYNEFKASYNEIINNSCSLLKDDSFACFVVSEVRDKKGNYYNFVADTIEAFTAAGLSYYNELILVNQIGTKAMTANKIFSSGRKVGRCHQNILVFLKGDAKVATAKIKEYEWECKDA